MKTSTKTKLNEEQIKFFLSEINVNFRELNREKYPEAKLLHKKLFNYLKDKNFIKDEEDASLINFFIYLYFFNNTQLIESKKFFLISKHKLDEYVPMINDHKYLPESFFVENNSFLIIPKNQNISLDELKKEDFFVYEIELDSYPGFVKLFEEMNKWNVSDDQAKILENLKKEYEQLIFEEIKGFKLPQTAETEEKSEITSENNNISNKNQKYENKMINYLKIEVEDSKILHCLSDRFLKKVLKLILQACELFKGIANDKYKKEMKLIGREVAIVLFETQFINEHQQQQSENQKTAYKWIIIPERKLFFETLTEKGFDTYGEKMNKVDIRKDYKNIHIPQNVWSFTTKMNKLGRILENTNLKDGINKIFGKTTEEEKITDFTNKCLENVSVIEENVFNFIKYEGIEFICVKETAFLLENTRKELYFFYEKLLKEQSVNSQLIHILEEEFQDVIKDDQLEV